MNTIFTKIERRMEAIGAFTAIIGGLALVVTLIVTCISVIGRSLIVFDLGPIPGDFELVEIGIGFSVFCFLPWCHINNGNAKVDLFEPFFSNKFNYILNILADLLMLLVALLILWRLGVGLFEKYSYQETTIILQFPVWITFALGIFGSMVFVMVSVFCLIRSIRRIKEVNDG